VVATSHNRFLIDPVTEYVGRIDATGDYVSIANPVSRCGETWPIEVFASRNRDAVCLECRNVADLPAAIALLQDKAMALDFWLMLFDPEIRDVTKTRIAAELNDLFSNDAVYIHVQNIVYSAPLSPSSSVRFVETFNLGERATRFANELLASRLRVQNLFAVWAGMKSEPLVNTVGHRELTGRLVSRSFFRKVVTQAKTQAELDQIKGNLAVELLGACDPRVLSRVLTDYKHTLPVGVRKRKAIAAEVYRHEEPEEPLQPTAKTAHAPAHELYQRAEKEVETIGRLYAEGKDYQASQFLDELVIRQLSGRPEFVVKSLCNIASRTSTSGRRDVSLQLLRRALEQPEGLDAILYLQIGNEFRNLREFDNALDCYQQAKRLDDGTKAEGIRDEIIRVSVAKGEYDLALHQYKEILNIHEQPSTLSSMGTLYRKMGDLRSARECYWSVLDKCNQSNDVADAGLAEATKQSGWPHRAIGQYQVLFKKYETKLEPASTRVYKLALSQLFKMTQQYERAIKELKGLLKDYSLDPDINFQLAKVYLLNKQSDLASDHLRLAKVPDLRGIAADLFRYAMSRSETVEAVVSPAEVPRTLQVLAYLPEDRGLAGCRNALAAIMDRQYDEALESLANIKFVDRIHNDFSSVLRFHANRGINPRYDFREDQSLCRILKRGFWPLRKTARSIADDRLEAAVQQELRFCLHVA